MIVDRTLYFVFLSSEQAFVSRSGSGRKEKKVDLVGD